MTLAEAAAGTGLHEGHRLWPHIQGWAAELGLTGPEAVAAASQPPGDINCWTSSRIPARTGGRPVVFG
jgi:hypothetical protein